MKQHRKKIMITGIATIFPMLVGLLLWSRMPDRIATHWGLQNDANGWSSKAFAVFGLPSLLFGIHILIVAGILNDPKERNINSKILELLFWIVPLASWLCCISSYLIAIGVKINIFMLANALMGIVFLVLGNYLPKSRQSYTVGIRLPWTLNSQENWSRTNRLGGKILFLGGILFLLNALLLNSIWMILMILILVFVPMGYSFILYKKGI